MPIRTKLTSRLIVLLIGVSVLLPALMFSLAAWRSYRDVVAENTARAERTVEMLQEHALKVLETHQLVIDQVNQRLQLVSWNFADRDASFHLLLKHLQEQLKQIATITVTDADGWMRASSRTFPADRSVSFADRDWFIALKNAPTDELFVSRSYAGRQSGQSVFNVADRVLSDNPGFQGAVAISVDRTYFENFYKQIETEQGNSFLLLRTDGQILARFPESKQATLRADELLAAVKRSSAGVVRVTSTVDGVERIVAFRRVGDYPLAVTFGVGRGAILAAWKSLLQTYAALAVASALALLAVSGFVIRHMWREHAATLRWQSSVEQLQAETAHREQLADQLRQSQKMDAVGRLTGGIAHDFNNLLTIVIGNLDLALKRLPDSEVRIAGLLKSAMDGGKRAASLTHRLLAFSRQQPLEPKLLDVNQLVSEMTAMLRPIIGETIAIETVLAGGLWKTLADPNQLENAVLNLAVNAKDAMATGGKLTIETANAHLDENYVRGRLDVAAGQYVMIAVSDTGEGMTPDVVQQAFEPFFTTKSVGKGTGLGLSQVYGFLKQSSGHAAIYSEVGHGSTVKLYLPRQRASDESTVVGAAETMPISRGRGEMVLVVEDDEAVRQFTVSALSEAGYRVIEAADGMQGLEELGRQSEVKVLFTDIVLGGSLNGRQLADEAIKRRPNLKVLFTTGYTRNAIIHHGRVDEGVNFLGKPFSASDLSSKIGNLLL